MSNYGEMLHSIPDDLRIILRNFERISKKKIMSTWSIKFNNIDMRKCFVA